MILISQNPSKGVKCIVCGKSAEDVVYYPVIHEYNQIKPEYTRRDFPFCSVECLELCREIFQKRRRQSLSHISESE